MKLKQKLKQFAGHTDIHVESENNWYRGNKDQLMQIINEEDMETEVVSSYLVGRENAVSAYEVQLLGYDKEWGK